jgi:TolA-binding protein
MAINIFYDDDFYANFTGDPNTENLIKDNDINYSAVAKEINDRIRSFKKELDLQLINVNNIQENNKKFLSLNLFANDDQNNNDQSNTSGLSVHKSRQIELKCSKQKTNLLNVLNNLNPQSIANLNKALSEFKACLKENKI